MRAMQAQLETLALQLEREKEKSEGLERMAQAIEKLAESNKGTRQNLVDPKGLGKPSNFGAGDEDTLRRTFPTWQRKTANYFWSVHPELKDPMEWAVSKQDQVTQEQIEQVYGESGDMIDQVEGLNEKLRQMHAVLMHITEGEANDIVNNANGQSLEAWGKLSRRWDPSTGGRIRNLLRAILNPGRAQLSQLLGILEKVAGTGEEVPGHER